MVESSGSDGSDVDLRILTPRFEEDRARILPLFGIPAHDLPENREMEMKKSMIETFIKGDKAYTIEYIAWAEDESPYAVLAEHLERTSGLDEERRKSESIQVHLDPGVRAFISSGLAHEFDSRRHGGVYLDLADHEVLSIRERKTAEELALLECANQVSRRPCVHLLFNADPDSEFVVHSPSDQEDQGEDTVGNDRVRREHSFEARVQSHRDGRW